MRSEHSIAMSNSSKDVVTVSNMRTCAALCALMFPSQHVSCIVAICEPETTHKPSSSFSASASGAGADQSRSAYDVIASAVKKWAPRVECFNTPECQHLSDRAMWHTCVSTHCRSRRGGGPRLHLRPRPQLASSANHQIHN